ncbi:MAG TPA: ABC transporter permease subunit [Oligoflexia bacterium]|nr:ABC transporter permease subunit [Oligoflexia bacterium]HMR24547.1 ABC transporter permease subunit [Oligoflexia bacterium]
MIRFIARRLVGIVITFFVAISLSFFIVRYAKGSPFTSERALTAEVKQALEERYGFDKPLSVQYVNYMKKVFFEFDLGLSTKYPDRTVNEIIGMSLPKTMLLGMFALFWAILVGMTAGIIGAVKQNTKWDFAAMSLAVVGISLPSFVLGPILALIFALSLLWFPAGGWGTFSHLVLPAITLGTLRAAYIARLSRSGMLEVVRSDFIRTARAKGLKESYIIWKHALKGGVIPVVSYLGPAIANIMVGSVVVEKIFNLPGMGPYFVDAAFNRDYFLVLGVVIVYSAFLLFLNLAVDVAYRLLDPRVEFNG